MRRISARGPLSTRRLRFAGLLLIAAWLAGCAPPAPLRGEQAWVRAAERGGVTAGYLILVNDSGTPAELTDVTSDAAAEIQMHESVREGAEVAMRRVARFAIASPGRLEFRPGGNHLMVMGVTRRLTPGNNVNLTLEFGDGRHVVVVAKVRE